MSVRKDLIAYDWRSFVAQLFVIKNASLKLLCNLTVLLYFT